MPDSIARDPRRAIGRATEQLSLKERIALVGKFVAFEIYTPKELPLHRIESIGDSLIECLRALKERGLDPKRFEFTRIALPY